MVGWPEALLTVSTILNRKCFFDSNFPRLEWNSLQSKRQKGLVCAKPCDIICNKTNNVRINVKWKRVLVTAAAVEKQQLLYILGMCLYCHRSFYPLKH
jgi:hypothetical protein